MKPPKLKKCGRWFCKPKVWHDNPGGILTGVYFAGCDKCGHETQYAMSVNKARSNWNNEVVKGKPHDTAN